MKTTILSPHGTRSTMSVVHRSFIKGSESYATIITDINHVYGIQASLVYEGKIMYHQ